MTHRLSTRLARPSSPPKLNEQKGAVLLVAAIFLIVLTILALSALRVATLQERMSGNLRDRNIAFQAAESALRAAEKYLAETSVLPSATFSGTTCSSKGVYKLVSGVPYFASTGNAFTSGTKWDGTSTDFWNEYPWEAANCAYSGSGDFTTFVAAGDLGKPGKPIKLPAYVIEELPPNGKNLPSYRVTAKGWGSSTASQVIIQATYSAN